MNPLNNVYIAAIDPGLASCGLVIVSSSGKLIAAHTLNNRGAKHSNEQAKYAAQELSNKVLQELSKYLIKDVVVEEFVDQGSVRKNFAGRWKTPFFIGYLISELYKNGYRVHFQNHNHIKAKDIRQITANTLAASLVKKPISEHANDALAHAVYFLRNRKAQAEITRG